MTGRSGFLSFIYHYVYGVLAAVLLLAAPISAIFVLAPSAAQAQAVFSSIVVVGNQRIEAESIRAFAAVETGIPLTPEDLNAAFRRLNETGLFDSIILRRDGNNLVIEVVENPTINRINIEGNNAIDDETLLAAIQLRPRSAYDRSLAEADAAILVDAYAATGRYNAEITPVIIKQPDNRVDLVFEVFEGKPTEIQRISFIGNRAVSDFRLGRVIVTGEAGLFSFLFSNDTYDQDRLEFDKQLLRQYYLERGYVDFEVRSASAEIVRDRSGFFVTFKLFEGEQYTIGETSVVILADQLESENFDPIVAELEPGDTYNVTRVEKVLDKLAFEAGRQGFAFVDVRPRITKNEDDLTIDIAFEMVEARRIFVERIDIRGNTQTLDRVIRRQFNLVEGDPFNAQKVADAQDKIRALGFFDDVIIRIREGSAPNLAIIDVEVEDASTGALGFGLGYSTSSGASVSVTLSEQNFLGRGQALRFEYTTAEDSVSYAFGFTEPALFDQDLAVGFDIFSRDIDRADRSSFELKTAAFQPRIEFPVSESGRLRLRYRLSSDKIVSVGADASPLIIADNGGMITSSIGGTYTFDRRNSRVDPSEGYLLVLDQEFSGFGGDTRFSKTVATARVYTNFFDEDVIVSGEIEGGLLASFSGGSRVSDRFFLGGDSFLGFADSGLGPRDMCTACGGGGGDVNDALGGNVYTVARLEASFPLGLPEDLGIFGGVFLNVGSLWSLDATAGGASGTIDDSAKIRASAGVSLFWTTPIGPLRFNFSRVIKKEAGDDVENFRLSISTRF